MRKNKCELRRWGTQGLCHPCRVSSGALPPLAGERFHLFGIAGRGLAPLAAVSRHLGAEVDGCDSLGFDDSHAYLESLGIAVAREHSPDHVGPGTTLVATSIAPPDHPEIRAAAARGAHWHRTELLAAVMRCRRSAGVTGSHGKGTVVALATAALASSGLDPVAVVGANVPAFGGYARLGSGPLVAEVDDSDGSLAQVDSDVAAVTNLDEDHPHLGIPLREVTRSVGAFVARARTRVVLGPSPRSDLLEPYAAAEVWRYGRDVSGRVVAQDRGETTVELRVPGAAPVRSVVRLLGARIEVNAALAFAVAVSMGADTEAAAAGLGDITSITRRMQLVGQRDGVLVYDDYGGKHPVNVREGLRALRQHYPSARIIALFEPYVGYLQRWGRRYAQALGHADRVVLVPAFSHPHYPARPGLDQTWTEAFEDAPVRAAGREDAAAVALGLAGPGDVIVVFAQSHGARQIAQGAVSTGGAV